MTNTDYDFLVAISRTLSEDDTLFNMVNGKFEIDYPLTKVAANIKDGNRTMISVAFPNIVSKALLGYDSHRTVDCNAMLQIDIASQYGNNSKYARDVAARVKVLIEGDITKMLDQQYNIYVDRVNDNTFFNEDIGAWQSSLIVYIEYLKSSK